jgi:Flp pilus assembly protein TadD
MSNIFATRRLALALALMLGCSSSGLTVVAQEANTTFQCGRNLFKSKMYKEALRYFKMAEGESPDDNRSFYYEALSYHQMGQLQAAMSAYQNVIAKFPDSEAADLSRGALKSFGMSYNAEASGGSLTKTANLRLDQVPTTMAIKAAEAGGKPVVEAIVSGVKIKFTVDKNYPDTIIGADVFKESRMRPGILVNRGSDKPSPAAAVKVETKTEKDKLDSKPEAKTEVKTDSKADAKVETKTETSVESKTETKVEAKVETTTATKVEPKADSTYLYEVKLGALVRTSFPVTISNKDTKAAVLGADFFNGANIAYDSKTATLTVKRAATYSNPFESGLRLYNTGKYSEAYPLLKKAAADRPNDPRALYLLAVSSHKAGRMEEARTRYRNVVQRFPSSEAGSLANSALVAMDPGFASPTGNGTRKGDVTGMIGAIPKDPRGNTFDLPYVAENQQFKVTAIIDGHNVEMYLISSLAEHQFSSDQIRQVDPSYLDQASDGLVVPMDPTNSNNFSTTSTRKVNLKRLQLGSIHINNTPAKIVDIQTRFGAAWPASDRPYLAGAALQGWRYEPIPQRRVLKFTRIQ